VKARLWMARDTSGEVVFSRSEPHLISIISAHNDMVWETDDPDIGEPLCATQFRKAFGGFGSLRKGRKQLVEVTVEKIDG